jgi:aminoglycoside phosphotransferase (APT) family kinase protein
MTAAVSPCDPDRPLDIARVERTLHSQFPELASARAEWFAAGCCSEVYRVSGDWLFRFPKRANIALTVEREVLLLSLLADATSVAVPRIEWLGQPGPDFPYPFAGYRLIPGIAAEMLPEPILPDDERRIATQIGQAIASIHRVPIERAKSLGAVDRPWNADALVAQAIDYSPSLDAVVPPALLADYHALLDGAVAPPPPAPFCRLAHGDLYAGHLLFDPETLELTGIVDFAEIGLQDPAVDFVQLFQWRGEAFIRMVLDAYGPHGDPWLLDRVRFDAAVNAGIWLAEVIDQQNEAAIAGRLSQLERNIGPTLRSMLRSGRG